MFFGGCRTHTSPADEPATVTDRRYISLKDADKIKILDPACGSGSFLIVAYQFLLDWYRDPYSLDPETSDGEMIAKAEKRHHASKEQNPIDHGRRRYSGECGNRSCESAYSAANILSGKDMRRKFELWMQDLWQALEHPSKDRSVLGVEVYGARRFIPELVRESLMVRQVLAFVEALRCTEMLGRQVQEEELMLILNSLAGNATGWLRDYGCQRVSAFDQIGAAPVEFQARLQALRELHDFAVACFAFKRPRDSFGGKRRGLAYGILGRVGGMADLPEVVTMARQSLKKANSVESRQAADFLKQYFTERDMPQDDTIVDELLSLAERTDSRSTVFSALDVLVENGAICEFEAMSRMDDWKSKHR